MRGRRHALLLAFAAASACAVATFAAGEVASAAPAPASQMPILVRSGDALYGLANGGGNLCLEGVFVPIAGYGSTGCGAILRYDARGAVSVVHLLVPSEGVRPYALRAAADGTLVGVTALGGAYGRGTAFRFDPKSDRFQVLQSFETPIEDRSLGFVDTLGGYIAAFDDGDVLTVDANHGTFLLLRGGSPPKTLYRITGKATLGPFEIARDGRAYFMVKSADSCDVALDALARDGTLATIMKADPAGSPACGGAVVADVRPLTAGDDGSLVANDEKHAYVARPGHGFVRIDVATAGADTTIGEAVPGTGADVLLALRRPTACGTIARVRGGAVQTIGTFDGTKTCFDADTRTLGLATLDDGLVGTIGDANLDTTTFAIAPGRALALTHTIDNAVQIKEVALVPYVTLDRASATAPLTATWSADGYFELPDLRVAPAAFDVTIRNLTAAHAAPERLRAASTKAISSNRIDMTNDKSVNVAVPMTLPRLAPGRYEIVAHARGAIRTIGGALQPVENDGFRSYWLVTPLDLPRAPKTDVELQELIKRYGGRVATVTSELSLTCDNGTPVLAGRGSTLVVKTIARGQSGAVQTGYGPLGLQTPGPGDAAIAYAPFTALDPIRISFGTVTGCTNPSAAFAADWDLGRYLRP